MYAAAMVCGTGMHVATRPNERCVCDCRLALLSHRHHQVHVEEAKYDSNSAYQKQQQYVRNELLTQTQQQQNNNKKKKDNGLPPLPWDNKDKNQQQGPQT